MHARDHHIDDRATTVVEAIAPGTDEWNGDELRSLFRDAYVAKWLRRGPLDDTATGALLAASSGNIEQTKAGAA